MEFARPLSSFFWGVVGCDGVSDAPKVPVTLLVPNLILFLNRNEIAGTANLGQVRRKICCNSHEHVASKTLSVYVNTPLALSPLHSLRHVFFYQWQPQRGKMVWTRGGRSRMLKKKKNGDFAFVQVCGYRRKQFSPHSFMVGESEATGVSLASVATTHPHPSAGIPIPLLHCHHKHVCKTARNCMQSSSGKWPRSVFWRNFAAHGSIDTTPCSPKRNVRTRKNVLRKPEG